MTKSVDPGSPLIASVLMQNDGHRAALTVDLKGDPGVDDFIEEFSFARRENLRCRLCRELGQDAATLARDGEDQTRRELVTACISVEHLRVEHELLRYHGFAFHP